MHESNMLSNICRIRQIPKKTNLKHTKRNNKRIKKRNNNSIKKQDNNTPSLMLFLYVDRTMNTKGWFTNFTNLNKIKVKKKKTPLNEHIIMFEREHN